jgi:hypothetical protein
MIVLPETRQFRGATVLDDETNLLVFRTISFAIFPLLLANRYLKAAGLPLDRHSLRAPFFSQCYVAAPFALVASIALILARVKSQAAQSCGAGLIGISLLWLFWIETRWFQRRLSLALTRAATSVAWAILQAISVLVALLIVFSGV